MAASTYRDENGVLRESRFNRPLVVPPEGGEPVPYTRCTTYIDVLEDKYHLQLWDKRMVAIGLSERPDLQVAVISHRDDKKELDKITAKAKEAARASAAATIGTAVHKFTEDMDAGKQIPDHVPDEVKRDLAAYRTATDGLTVAMSEQFHVLDSLKIGGTPDRIVEYNGKHYIADLKTGSTVDLGALKIAMQLGVYAHATPYSYVTDERTPRPFTVDTDRGIVIHLPAGSGRCEVRWVDISQGWRAVQTAGDVRGWRKVKATDLYEPFGDPVSIEETPATKPDAGLMQRIETAATVDDLRDLWAEAQVSGVLTTQLQNAIYARKAVLS